MRAYLAGAIEGLPDRGTRWRIRYQKLLAELTGIEGIRPADDIEDILGISVNTFLGYKQTDLLEYIRLMRLIRKHDFDLIDSCDFVITKWEGPISAGTIGEADYVASKGMTNYLIHDIPIHEVPGWILPDFTKIFNSDFSFFNFLLSEETWKKKFR